MFSICFCGQYCLFLASICFSHPPSKNRISSILPRQMAAQLKMPGYFAVGVETWQFVLLPLKWCAYLPAFLFPILWEEMWNWCWDVHFDCVEKQSGTPGVESNRVKGIWITLVTFWSRALYLKWSCPDIKVSDQGLRHWSSLHTRS